MGDTFMLNPEEIINKIKEIENNIIKIKQELSNIKDKMTEVRLPIEEAIYNDKSLKNADMRRIALEKALNSNPTYKHLKDQEKQLTFDLNTKYNMLHYYQNLFEIWKNKGGV